jgi:hypothetical protein
MGDDWQGIEAALARLPAIVERLRRLPRARRSVPMRHVAATLVALRLAVLRRDVEALRRIYEATASGEEAN